MCIQYLVEDGSAIRVGGSVKARRLLQASSVFGMESYGEPPTLSRCHGYAVGQITFAKKQADFRLYPRIATDKPQGEGWRYIADVNNLVLPDGWGTAPETLLTFKAVPITQPQPGSSESDTNDQTSSSPNSAILQKVITEISKLLSAEEVKVFTAELQIQLTLTTDQKPTHPQTAEAIVNMLIEGGEDVPVISRVLLLAAENCLSSKGQRYHDCLNHAVKIREVIEQLLGWLVLANVGEGIAPYLQGVADLSKLYFKLPVETAFGTEVVIAHKTDRPAKFKQLETDPAGAHVITACASDADFDISDTLNLANIKLNLWKALGRTGKLGTDANINSLIRQHLLQSKKHFYLAFKCSAAEAQSSANDAVIAQLAKDLKDLTIVQFGIGDDAVFVIPEYDFMNAILVFIGNVNQFNQGPI